MRIIHCAPFNLFIKTGNALYANPIKISHGLIQNGHFVHNFDYRETSRYMSFFRNKKNGQNKMNQLFISIINDIKPDLIIFGHAELIKLETLEYIKKKHIQMCFWYNDIPIDSEFYLKAPYFNIILSTAGGMFIDNLRLSNRNCFFMPNLVNKNIEKYEAFKHQNFNNQLLFSGRLDEERKQIIKTLKSTFSQGLKIIGESKQTTIIGDAYFDLIQNSKICINHNRHFTLENKWYTSDRLMHILGNGSFCLSTQILDGEKFFEDKLVYYKSTEELCEKIKYFQKHDNERSSKAQWLHTRVHELFNTQKVTQYILDLLHQNTTSLKTYEWWEEQ